MKLGPHIAAIVTGDASGLGAAAARRLASHGVPVALFDLDEARGNALARELGGVFCQVDVTSDEQVERAFTQARAIQGQERSDPDSITRRHGEWGSLRRGGSWRT